jgi:hypothetical protein
METQQKWYLVGKKLGKADMLKDQKRDISKYPEEFQRGYKESARESWWYRMNDKITNALARLGSSRLR